MVIWIDTLERLARCPPMRSLASTSILPPALRDTVAVSLLATMETNLTFFLAVADLPKASVAVKVTSTSGVAHMSAGAT